MVARGGDLPDLSALVSGQQRRRHRRPAGHRRAVAAYRQPRRRCGLDLAVLHLADEGFRLRRQRLLRCRPDVRQPRRFRRGGGDGACAGAQGADRPGAVAHLRPAPVVSRKPRQPRQSAGGLVCLGRCQTRRHAAQQLAVDLRRLGLAMGFQPLPVLPAQLPRLAARPQFPLRRGAGRAAGRRPLLAAPRGRRLSPRYDQFLYRRQAVARQSRTSARGPQREYRAGGEPLQLARTRLRQEPAGKPRFPCEIP